MYAMQKMHCFPIDVNDQPQQMVTPLPQEVGGIHTSRMIVIPTSL